MAQRRQVLQLHTVHGTSDKLIELAPEMRVFDGQLSAANVDVSDEVREEILPVDALLELHHAFDQPLLLVWAFPVRLLTTVDDELLELEDEVRADAPFE